MASVRDTPGIPSACAAVCAPYTAAAAAATTNDTLLGAPSAAQAHDGAAEPMVLDVSVPAALPPSVPLPQGVQAGTVIMRIVQQPGQAPLSSQTFLSYITQALAGVGGPIQCTPVPNTQYTALWQTVSITNTTFVGCAPNISQVARNAAAGRNTAPPTLQCTAPNNDASTGAAKAQLRTAIGAALRTPGVQPQIPTDTLLTYLVGVLTNVLTQAGGAGTRLCTQNALLRNAVNLDGALFSYPSFAQCAQCVRTGKASGTLPVCLDISQTVAHPMMQCLSQGLSYSAGNNGGGGGGGGSGGGNTPTPAPAKTKLPIKTIAIAAGTLVLLIVIVSVAVAVAKRRAHHGH